MEAQNQEFEGYSLRRSASVTITEEWFSKDISEKKSAIPLVNLFERMTVTVGDDIIHQEVRDFERKMRMPKSIFDTVTDLAFRKRDFKSSQSSILEKTISDEELRLKCLDFVSRSNSHSSPIYLMINAALYFRYVKKGELPVKTSVGADVFVERLLAKVLDILLNEREKSVKSNNTGKDDSDNLNIPESFVSKFLSALRFKRPNQSSNT